MIFSPLPGTPTVTQGFGQNPDIYKQFDLEGHNGIDFDTPIGTTIYAPHEGTVWAYNQGDEGYGQYIVLDSDNRRSILAHLSEILVEGGDVYQGDPIAKAGDTGFCTAPHLHWTFKIKAEHDVKNRDNGYDGAVDVTEFTRLWLDQDMHNDANYTEEAKPYLEMTFGENVYLKNPNRDIT